MKEFFVEHTEKLVFGLCALIAGWLLFSTFSLAPYDKSPQDFEEVINRARQNVSGSTPQIDDLPPLEFDKEYAKLGSKIDSEAYKLSTPLYRPMELSYQFRGAPSGLQPGTPEVLANRGLVVLGNRPADQVAKPKVFDQLISDGYPAELIWFLGNLQMRESLGLIEREANKGTTKTDDNKKKPEPKDGGRVAGRGVAWVEIVAPYPHADQIREFVRSLKEGAETAGVRYALAEVERRELTATMEWSPWKPIPWKKAFDLFESAEKLDDPFEELPPGVVVPGLAMTVPERARVGSDGPRVQVSAPLIPSEFKNASVTKWTPEELDPRGVEEAAAPRDKELDEEAKPIERGTFQEGTFKNFNSVETAMMRVFDFTVEPGKRYQYRIRARLFNPNFDRPDVIDPDQSQDIFIMGAWSEPSPEVYIEPNNIYSLGEGKGSREGRATFSVFYWLEKIGRWVSQDFTHQVGQVIGSGNSRNTVKVPVLDPKDGKVTFQDEDISSEMTTRSVLLEVGPTSIRESLGSAGEVIILPPRQVVVLNEFGDLLPMNEVDDLADPARIDRDNAIAEGLKTTSDGDRRTRSRDSDASDSRGTGSAFE